MAKFWHWPLLRPSLPLLESEMDICKIVLIFSNLYSPHPLSNPKSTIGNNSLCLCLLHVLYSSYSNWFYRRSKSLKVAGTLMMPFLKLQVQQGCSLSFLYLSFLLPYMRGSILPIFGLRWPMENYEQWRHQNWGFFEYIFYMFYMTYIIAQFLVQPFVSNGSVCSAGRLYSKKNKVYGTLFRSWL